MLKKIKNKLIFLLKNNYIYKKIQLHKKLNSIKKNPSSIKKKKRHNYQIELKIKYTKINFKKIIITILFLLIGSLIFVYNSSFFNIKKIEILRQDPRSNISIAYMAIGNIKGKKIFKVNKNKLEEKLKNYQNNLNYIKIFKIYPSTLKIKIGSYPEIYNTIINNKYYLILENGAVIPVNKLDKNLLLLNLKTKKQEKFVDYKKILNSNYLEKIKYIEDKLHKNLLTNIIKEIHYYPVEREVHFILKNGTILIFDLNQDKKGIDEQIEKIIIFDKQYHKINKNNIVYIDLRIKNKIFFCDKEQEFICKQNLKRIYE